jgi:hypothetical protein
MTNTNRKNAIETINNLAEALEACGIEATVEENADNILLYAHLWNCKDGSTDRLEVWADENSDYEIESCSVPVSTVDELLASL